MPPDASDARVGQADTSRRVTRTGVFKALGLGIVTGASDDDCSAIGTYASVGAKFGPAFLWTAPVTFPMMYAVVYLSSKLGQVSGRGLFHVIKDTYPVWLLWPILIGVLFGNVVEAAADLGGMASAINIFIPVPIPVVVALEAGIILALQIWGSYELIRNVFRWLALTLLAYVASGILAKPNLGEVLYGTFVPTVQFSGEFLSMLVAVIGTTLSAYLYTWQSNIEVEEEILEGHTELEQPRAQPMRNSRDLAETFCSAWVSPMSSCTSSSSRQPRRCTRPDRPT